MTCTSCGHDRTEHIHRRVPIRGRESGVFVGPCQARVERVRFAPSDTRCQCGRYRSEGEPSEAHT